MFEYTGREGVKALSEWTDNNFLKKKEAYGKNLLINSDFKINQRGKTGAVTAVGYFVDRWQLVSGSVTVNSDKTITLNGTIKQILENAPEGGVTASASAGTAAFDSAAKAFTLTASGKTISWAKLEYGSIATPFIPPDPAEELIRCQRYCISIPGGRYGRAAYCGNTVIQFVLPMSTPMRSLPSVSGGGFSVDSYPNGNEHDTSFAVTVGNAKENGHLTVSASKAGHGLSDAILWAADKFILDAEIY